MQDAITPQQQPDTGPGDPQVGAVVRCEVQLHREEYAVVSIPSLDQALAYVGRDDFNKRGTNLAEALPLDTTHSFRVGLLPEEDTGQDQPHSSHPKYHVAA